jgi:hypothetical protein
VLPAEVFVETAFEMTVFGLAVFGLTGFRLTGFEETPDFDAGLSTIAGVSVVG